jgi:hypothetical protein
MFPMLDHPLAILAAIAALGLAPTARATVYEVKAGDDWAALAPKLVAGDEVVLLEGIHREASFNKLAGAPGKPIVFRSRDAKSLAEIAPSREGIRLVDCSHIRIERVLVKNARRAAILIEGTGEAPSTDIVVNDLLVMGVKDLVEESGLVVRDSDHIEIARSRFENCRGSGMHIENSSHVSVDRVQMRVSKFAKMGIALLGEVDQSSFQHLWIAGGIETALSIGATDVARHAPSVPVIHEMPEQIDTSRLKTPPASEAKPEGKPEPKPEPQPEPKPEAPPSPATDAPAPSVALVRNVHFSDVLVIGADRAFDFGSCDQVSVANSTLIGAREEVYRFTKPSGGRPPATIRFRNNIITWEPGGLRRIGHIEAGASVKGFILGPNIWWSNELPSALPLLGPAGAPFLGTLESAQRIDLDPDLDDQNRPRAQEAKTYGQSAD